MNHLNSYKVFEYKYKSDSKDSEMAKDYIHFFTNFPEIENIKMITQDLTDWCYINTKQVKFWSQLLRTNNNSISYMPTSILWDIQQGYFDYKNEIYYKSYCFFVTLPNNDIKMKDLLNQIDLAEKRLKKYGFYIMRGGTELDDSFHKIVIYVIDKNDPVTMEDIINKYNEKTH